jgi:hypothetical protein
MPASRVPAPNLNADADAATLTKAVLAEVKKAQEAPQIPPEVVERAARRGIEFKAPTKKPNPTAMNQDISRVLPEINDEMTAGVNWSDEEFFDYVYGTYREYKNNQVIGQSCHGKCLTSVMCKWECFLDSFKDTMIWRKNGNDNGTINFSLRQRLISEAEAKHAREFVTFCINKVGDLKKRPVIVI